MSICNECWGKGWIKKQGVQFVCRKCKGMGVIENEPQTNFEQITKDEATLTDWLQEKMCFCTEISCDECIAYKECWHQGNDTDYSNADLWNAWLKQPHKEE